LSLGLSLKMRLILKVRLLRLRVLVKMGMILAGLELLRLEVKLLRSRPSIVVGFEGDNSPGGLLTWFNCCGFSWPDLARARIWGKCGATAAVTARDYAGPACSVNDKRPARFAFNAAI